MVYKISTFERYTANFRFTPEGYAIIENASEPIIISNNDYYWDSQFKTTLDRPVICEMKEDSYGWPLGEVRFENGTRARSLYFSCPDTSFCGMLTCHSKDVSLLVAIAVLAFFAFLICMCYVCWFRHRIHENQDEPYELRQMVPLVFSADDIYPDEETETSMAEVPFEIRPPPPYSEVDLIREDMALIQ